ncbi:MAG: PAS domain-containing sensor histidine kinase [Candidatus Thorarchaeota archaeon]|nr:PAS domain-containing sensor histidine kinase [Candidatus Thorarchaeota archaeon]
MATSLAEIVADRSRDGYAVIDQTRRIIYVNERWCSLSGLPREKVIGRFFVDIHPKTVRPVLDELITTVFGGGTVPADGSFHSLTTPDGSPMSAQMRLEPLKLPDGSPGALAILVDVTNEIERRQALEEQEAKFQVLVETMTEAFSIDDLEGRVVYANSSYCRLLGLERSDVIGKKWIDWTVGLSEEEYRQKLSARHRGESERYEMVWRRRDGSRATTIVSAAPYFDIKGNLIGTFAVITDITEQKDAEETIQFYLDLLTHDIANQLQIIMTSSGLLDCEMPPNYVEEARQNIADAVDRCNRLITKVKRAGQLKFLSSSTQDLSAILLEKSRAVERVYGARVHLSGLHEDVLVVADALLGELMWNLLENAARHNPKESKEIWVELETTDSSVKVSVSDNGPGISDAKKAIIFERSKRSGGVGLTLVYQMVRKYGGQIELGDRVDGQPAQGARFTVTLRRA